jgi:hypothetical protein
MHITVLPRGILLGIALLPLATAHADPLPSPAFSPTLSPNPAPIATNDGPLGHIYVSGQLSGLALVQSHPAVGAEARTSTALADIANAQVEVQTTSGPVQFYVQAGAYALPALGSPTPAAGADPYGPVPVAFVKLVASPQLSVEVGELPTLIGAEATFTFQNVTIERGLLWNQEPAISKGVQVNYAQGALTAAISLNDGFASDHYTWLSGMLGYMIDGHSSLSVVGGGNLGRTARATPVTPLPQDNGAIVNLIYTWNTARITLTPYLQYTRIARDRTLGIDQGTSTIGAAILGRYALGHRLALGARAEYEASHGGRCATATDCTDTNLLYGAGSRAWSLTLTPTWQAGAVFVRAEASYTRIGDLTIGDGLGPHADRRDQVRGMLEAGLVF